MEKEKDTRENPQEAVIKQIKLILMIVLAVALVVPFISTSMAVRSINEKIAKLKLGPQEEIALEKEEVKELPMAFYKPLEFLVNLGDTEANHYLRATVSLGAKMTEKDLEVGKKPEKKSGGHGGGHGGGKAVEAPLEPAVFKLIEAQEPIVRDIIISVISNYSMESLVSTAGKQELKETIRTRLRQEMKNEDLEIYFTSFTLQ